MAISAKQRVIDEVGDMHSSFVRDAIESIGNASSSSDSGSGVDSSKMDLLAQSIIGTLGITIVGEDLDEASGLIYIVSEQASLITPGNTTPVDYSIYVCADIGEAWDLVYSGQAPLMAPFMS